MSKVLWNDFTAPELKAAAAANPVVILPIGSTEQHGPHLPVQVDSLLVSEVARRAAERMAPPALVMPVVWTGLAEHHMNLGGTVTLDFATFHALVRQICLSITRQGFRRIAILNGHGGNILAVNLLSGELAKEVPGVVAVATYFVLAQSRFAPLLDRQEGVRHACEAETAMMLALRPDLVDLEAAARVDAPAEGLSTEGFARWRPIEHWSASGVIGFPAAASAEKGQRLIEAAAAAVAEHLDDTDLWLPAAPQRLI